MASKPGYLEASWNKVKAVMVEPGKLDLMSRTCRVCLAKRMIGRVKSDGGNSVVRPRSLREVSRVTGNFRFSDKGFLREPSKSKENL